MRLRLWWGKRTKSVKIALLVSSLTFLPFLAHPFTSLQLVREVAECEVDALLLTNVDKVKFLMSVLGHQLGGKRSLQLGMDCVAGAPCSLTLCWNPILPP